MSSLPSLLSDRIFGVTGIDPELRPATKPQFGHYQTNVALRLAKSEGQSPREVATRGSTADHDQSRRCQPEQGATANWTDVRPRIVLSCRSIGWVCAALEPYGKTVPKRPSATSRVRFGLLRPMTSECVTVMVLCR